MSARFVVQMVVINFAVCCGLLEATAQDSGKPERKAAVSGILKSRTPIKNRKDVIIEILADGDEKPRRYGVPYIPNGKGPITEVLGAVQRASLGDRVHCELIYGAYGYESGFTVTAFQVLRKASPRKDDGTEKK